MNEYSIRKRVICQAKTLYPKDHKIQEQLVHKAMEIFSKVSDPPLFTKRHNENVIAASLLYFAHLDKVPDIQNKREKPPEYYNEKISEQRVKIKRTKDLLNTQKNRLVLLSHQLEESKNQSVTYSYLYKEKIADIANSTSPTISKYIGIIDEKIDVLKTIPGVQKRRKSWENRSIREKAHRRFVDENPQLIIDTMIKGITPAKLEAFVLEHILVSKDRYSKYNSPCSAFHDAVLTAFFNKTFPYRIDRNQTYDFEKKEWSWVWFLDERR